MILGGNRIERRPRFDPRRGDRRLAHGACSTTLSCSSASLLTAGRHQGARHHLRRRAGRAAARRRRRLIIYRRRQACCSRDLKTIGFAAAGRLRRVTLPSLAGESTAGQAPSPRGKHQGAGEDRFPVVSEQSVLDPRSRKGRGRRTTICRNTTPRSISSISGRALRRGGVAGIEGALAKKYDGHVVVPIFDGTARIINEATEEGLPVFNIIAECDGIAAPCLHRPGCDLAGKQIGDSSQEDERKGKLGVHHRLFRRHQHTAAHDTARWNI